MCDFIMLEEDVTKAIGVAFDDVFYEESSTIRQKRIGRHLWYQRPGVVGHWYYPALLRCCSSSFLESIPDWGRP